MILLVDTMNHLLDSVNNAFGATDKEAGDADCTTADRRGEGQCWQSILNFPGTRYVPMQDGCVVGN